MAQPERSTRLTSVLAVTCSSLSVAILAFVGATGPSAGTVLVHHAAGWPPWFGALHLADWAVTAVMWAALLLGVAGVTAGLAAVRRGWRPAARWLVTGALTAVGALAVVPAIGSTDTLDYAAYGRIAALGRSPYVMTPEQLRRAHDPIGVLAPHIWEKLPSVYGPLATASQWAASELGGSSAALTIFWIKVWNGLAFLAVVFALDWLTRSVPAMQARAHLLWSVNPLMLWAVMAGGHVDGLAIAIAVMALAVLGRAALLSRDPGGIETKRAFASGLLLGAATAVKAPFILFGAGLAWVARRSPRTLAAAAAGGLVMLAAVYLAAGRSSISDAVHRGYGIAGDNLWGAVYRAFGMSHPIRHLTFYAIAAFAALAVLICVPLVFLPASRLDWVILGRAVAGNIAYIPGVEVILHPRWLEGADTKVVMYIAPSGRLLALVALIVLCLTGGWNRRLPWPEAAVPSEPVIAAP